MRLVPFALAVLALSGCTARQTDAPAADSTAVVSPAPVPTTPSDTLRPRPSPAPFSGAAITDTLLIEGTPDAVRVQPIRETAFPLPFEARVPEPMAYETVSSDEGDAARFKLGDLPDGSLLTVFVLPETATEASARSFARSVAGTQGTVSPDENAPAWALDAVRTRQGTRAGSVALGQHAGRYFYVLTDVAAEAFDGFGPREDYILRHWRWLDDGTTLAE